MPPAEKSFDAAAGTRLRSCVLESALIVWNANTGPRDSGTEDSCDRSTVGRRFSVPTLQPGAFHLQNHQELPHNSTSRCDGLLGIFGASRLRCDRIIRSPASALTYGEIPVSGNPRIGSGQDRYSGEISTDGHEAFELQERSCGRSRLSRGAVRHSEGAPR